MAAQETERSQPQQGSKKRKAPATGLPSTASPLAIKRQKLYQTRQKLPIFPRAKDIRTALSQHPVLVLSGETGSGKSTQVPQFLLQAGWCTGKIAITQPRRVAAISLARRVAEEMGSPLGSASPASKVGYSVRFDENTSPGTRIKYLTEGMLLQELLRDATLSQYSCVVVDEVHERSVNVDLLLGFLKNLVYGRRKGSLRVVVMSATADVEGISRFFDTPPGAEEQQNGDANQDSPKDLKSASSGKMVSQCHVEGRQFPVKTHYLSAPTEDVIDAALQRILQIHCKEPLPGDLLVFLTGQEAIQGLQKLVEDLTDKLPPGVPRLQVLPLYAALPQDAQQRIFEPAPRFTRKVILSTNIAETSVTVPGVRFVIDTGKAKMKQFRPRLGLESLLAKPISKSSADQRKGRAGREAPGQCFRLYTESAYKDLEQDNAPEIQRCDLGAALLAIKARDASDPADKSAGSSSGIDDILTFPFLTPPTQESLERALLQLLRLDALNPTTGRLTALGKQMSRLPLPPRLARVLVEAARPDRRCVRAVIDVVAALSGEALFLAADTEEDRERAAAARAPLLRRSGDHLTLLAALRGYAAEQADRKRWARDRMLSHRALKAAMAVRKQLRAQCAAAKLLRAEEDDDDDTNELLDEDAQAKVLKCFLRGFRDHVARLCPDRRYRAFASGGGGANAEADQAVAIHPSSVLFGRKVEAVVYTECVYTTKVYARGVSTIELRWLDELLEESGVVADEGSGAEVSGQDAEKKGAGTQKL